MKIKPILFATLLAACSAGIKNGGTNSITDGKSWQPDTTWPVTNTIIRSNPTGLDVDSHNHLFVFQRVNRTAVEPYPATTIDKETILMLDAVTGKVVNKWGSNLFIMPHGLTVDAEDNVWVTDIGLNQIFKFTHNGQLLLKLGEANVPGNDEKHFNRPTDIAIANDGSVYISDGYRNSRVVKFSKEGRYLMEWGTKGNGPGQFNLPHAIALDKNENVYVADRSNKRVQVFNKEGKFLTVYEKNAFEDIYAVCINRNTKGVIAVDYKTEKDTIPLGSDILIFTTEGTLKQRFGRSGNYSGSMSRYHDITTDSDGNIYVADILKNRVQKFQWK